MFENIQKIGAVLLELVPWPILQSVIIFNMLLLSFIVDLSSYFYGGFLLNPIIGLCMLANNINFGRKYRRFYSTTFTIVQVFPDYFISWVVPFIVLAVYQHLASLLIYGILSIFVILYYHQCKLIDDPEKLNPFKTENCDQVMELSQDEIRRTIAKEIAHRFHDIFEQKVIMDLECYHIEADNNMDDDTNETFTQLRLLTKHDLILSISNTAEVLIEHCSEAILTNYLVRHVSEDDQTMSVTSNDPETLSEMSISSEEDILTESENSDFDADLAQLETMQNKSIFMVHKSKSMPILSTASFRTSFRVCRNNSAHQLSVLRPGLLVASARKSRPHCITKFRK